MHSFATKIVALVLLITPFTLLSFLGFVFVASRPTRPSSPWLSVAPVAQIPTSDQPAYLPIMAPRYDAWSRLPDEVVGHVFVRRDAITNEIKVISTLHGRLFVPVDYDQHTGCYTSRCFGIRFDMNGRVIQDQNARSLHEEGMPAIDFTIVDDVLFVRNTQS